MPRALILALFALSACGGSGGSGGGEQGSDRWDELVWDEGTWG